MAEQSSDPVLLTLLIIGSFAIVFPLFWCSILWIISLLDGWQWLAQRYRSSLTPSGRVWTWQYGSVNWAGYNGALKLTANADGLFMETLWIFSFGHARLFIPWQDFREAKVGYFFFLRQVRAKVGSPALAMVRLPAAVFEESEGRRVLTGPQ
jgi:hypothetical protein